MSQPPKEIEKKVPRLAPGNVSVNQLSIDTRPKRKGNRIWPRVTAGKKDNESPRKVSN